MRLILRDDDTNFFTRVDELENAFGELWEKGIPVTLGVIPWVKRCKIRGVKFPYGIKDEHFPIGGNERLVRFLKCLIRLDLVEIAMHGIYHEDYASGPEFVGKLIRRGDINKAKSYLETTFDSQIIHFIPPHNSINSPNFTNVVKEGMRVLTSFSHMPHERPLSIGNLVHFCLSGASILINQNKSYRYRGFKKIYPGKELGCHHILSSYDIEKLRNYLISGNHNSNHFTGAASHYWEINEKNLNKPLLEMVKLVESHKCKFTLPKFIEN